MIAFARNLPANWNHFKWSWATWQTLEWPDSGLIWYKPDAISWEPVINKPNLGSNSFLALDNLFWPTVDIKNFNDNVFIYSTKYKKKLVNY